MKIRDCIAKFRIETGNFTINFSSAIAHTSVD